MGDYHERAGAAEDAFERGSEVFGVECGEAFVEDDEAGVLQQGARDVDSAALAMRELPAAFADHLQKAAGHAIEYVSQTQLAADGVRLFHVRCGGRPAPAH